MNDPFFLSLDEVVELHGDQIRLFGGTPGIRDLAALESAVSTPAATFGGAFLHQDLFEMAAAYAFHIAQNQPFLDGNKRAGLNACLVFLLLNGWDVPTPGEALYDGVLGFAMGTMDKRGFAAVLRSLAVQGPSTEP